MDMHGWIAVAVLFVAMVLFITKPIPLAVTALCIPVVLAAFGVVHPAESVLAGFGSVAVISLAGIHVLSAGLQATGVATMMGNGIERFGRRSEFRVLVLVMVVSIVLSAFASTSATLAVLLPAIALSARRTGMAPSKLLLPLAYATILGGTLTLIGAAPQLVLDSLLRARGAEGFGVFEFSAVGVPVAIMGTLYMVFVGGKLLPEREAKDQTPSARRPEDLAMAYGFDSHLYRADVSAASKLSGLSLRNAKIGEEYNLEVVLIRRRGGVRHKYRDPRPDMLMQPGLSLYVEGADEDVKRFSREQAVDVGLVGQEAARRLIHFGSTLAEITLDPRSGAIGKTLKELEFRKNYGLNVVSIWRGDTPKTSGISTMPLRLGDALLVSGPVDRVRRLREQTDFIALGAGGMEKDYRLAPIAILAVCVALIPPLVGWLPLAVSVIPACMLTVLTGCITPQQAGQSINWTVLFLLIGTLPLGLALDQTGVAEHVAGGVMAFRGPFGTLGVLAALYLLAALLSTTSNNVATAVILAPVAWKAAEALGMPPHKAFLSVAFGASCTFIFPFAHQCNLMVQGAGRYETRDFVRVGVGMSLVVATSTLIMLALM